jgi:PAS domain S-box-containing protein
MATSKKSKKELLRQRAEKLLPKRLKTMPKIQDTKALVHELQVHQIELEMQNEELRKAQIEIEESRTKYSDLYDFSPVGYFTFNPAGEIIEANLTGADLLGVDRSLLLHRSFSLFVDPEFRTPFRDHRLKVLKQGGKERCELKFIKKNGHSFYGFLESIAVSQGRNQRIQSAISDITELKKAQEKGETEHAFRIAVENSILSGIAAVDVKGRQSYVNLGFCRMVGRSEEELIGREPPFAYWPPEDSDHISRVFRTMINGKAPREGFELRFMRKNGERFDALVIPSPLKDPLGKAIGWIATFGDITHLKEMEKELKQLNTRLEERVHQRTAELENTNEQLKREITGRKQAEAQLTADLAALTQMHKLSGRLLGAAGLQPLLQEIIDVAVAIVGAERGTLQLLEDDSLRIVAHHGHQQPFLDFFASAENRTSVCGEATRRGERVIVPDVEASPLFSGTSSLAVLREAGVSAIQSTPMLSRTGTLIGILTTQWSVPYSPNEHDLWRIDLLARQAADLIEYARAEEALRNSEDRYRSLADNIPSVLMRYEKNSKVLYLSPKAEEITGVPTHQFIGKTNREVGMPEHLCVLWENAIQEVFCTAQNKDLEFDFRSKQGQRTFYLKLAPEFGPDGAVKHVLGISTEITERKRMEESLRQSEEKFRIFAENTRDMEAWISPEGKFVFLSPSSKMITGYDPGEFIENPGLWNNIMHPEDFPIFDRHRQGKEPASQEIIFRIIRPDGSTRWIGHTCQRIFDEEGRFLGTRSSNRDITERKQMEDELRKSRDELERRVQERTVELAKVNEELRAEIAERKRAEEAIKEERQRFNDVLEMLPAYLVLLAPDYHVPFANRFFRERFGESHGRRCFEYLFGRSEPCEICETYTVLKTNAPHHWEWTGPDGCIYDVFDFPFTDTDGSTLILEMGIDITERKQAEKSLQKNMQMLDLANDAIVIFDLNDRITYWNKGAERLYGWERKEALGQQIHTLLKTVYPIPLEDMKESLYGREHTEMELTHTKKDGTRVSIESRWTLQQNEKGQPVAFLEINNDITERKRMEEELRAISLYARGLIEASLDPLVTISADGKVMDVNKATELATGVSRKDLIGSDFSNYFTEPDRAKKGYAKVFSEGFVKDYPLAIRHTTGHTTDVLYNATVYKNEAAEVQGVFAAARDITEFKRAEEALRESENRLRSLSSQLLSVQENERRRISREIHDSLGQSLSAIKFKIENITHQMQESSYKEMLGPLLPIIQESIEESRRIQMDLRPSILDDLGIIATLTWFTREFQKIYFNIRVDKEIEIAENEMPDTLKTVIYRISQEALNNIAKHSQADSVRLSLKKAADRIELTIQDNGKGFDPEITLATDRPRKGLGLTSMRERAELSGGTFAVESTPGKGTIIKASWAT